MGRFVELCKRKGRKVNARGGIGVRDLRRKDAFRVCVRIQIFGMCFGRRHRWGKF